MSLVKIRQVIALPVTPEANTLYYVRGPETSLLEIVLVGSNPSEVRHLINKADIQALIAAAGGGGGGGGAVAPRKISTSTYTLQAADAGATLTFTNTNGCVVTVPAGLPGSFWVNLLTNTTAQVTVAPANGSVFINNSYGHVKSAGMPFAMISLTGTDTNEFALTGRTGV
jgi:hypothetical protein